MLGEEPLHHDRIAAGRPLAERPGLAAAIVAQPPRGRSHLMPWRDRLTQIPADHIDRNADLASDRLFADPTPRQRPNRGYHLAFEHRYVRGRRYEYVPLAGDRHVPLRFV